ncbi:PIF1-like helicase domain containing protein [Tylopilus felleus]
MRLGTSARLIWPSAIFKSFSCRGDAEQWVSASHRLERAPSHPENPSQSDAAIRVQKHPVEPPGERGAPVSPPEPVLQVQTPTVILSKEQRAVLEMVQRRENIFFTGSAGTGKSVLLRSIIDACGGKGCPTLAITASTGIASVNIGGTTLHSWAGIGIGKEDAKKLVGKFLGQEKLRPVLDRWRRVETLILDESARIL